MMKWHIYKTRCVDAFCNNLKTVSETKHKIMRSEAVSLLAADARQKGPNALAFANGWSAARAAASEKGWDGLERSDTTVFWLPFSRDFLYGFVIKPSIDDETSLIVSPCPLAWLTPL